MIFIVILKTSCPNPEPRRKNEITDFNNSTISKLYKVTKIVCFNWISDLERMECRLTSLNCRIDVWIDKSFKKFMTGGDTRAETIMLISPSKHFHNWLSIWAGL